MAFSQRESEGYLRIDHRDSPGFKAEEVIGKGMPLVGKGQLFEAPTYSCSHCQRLVIVNPLRTRDRAYCRSCDHIVCDLCEAERVRTGVCKPFKQTIDEFFEKAQKGLI